MTDKTRQAQTLYGRPDQMNGAPDGWRIELRRDHILAGQYHAYLRLVDARGNTVGELHGFAQDTKFDKENNHSIPTAKGVDGSFLVARQDKFIKGELDPVATVAAGSKEEIAKIWQRGVEAADAINEKGLPYKATDGPRDLGGEIQNSNSVAYTLGQAMGLPLDGAVEDAGLRRAFPGWGRNILDPNYQPYIPPPQFGQDASRAP